MKKFKNKKDSDDSLVKNKTKLFPDKNNNCELDAFFEKLWNINLKEKNNKKQLLTQTKTSLRNIQENENIIIKEAEKGNAVVI